ncbi:MAG: mechanosensitive ion channel [Prevotella sp.]|nr:mechanosensitive ion channel [Prevotella sp.]MCM1074686.1 mechanosensitive ion channel [Ruminococcus sp.]
MTVLSILLQNIALLPAEEQPDSDTAIDAGQTVKQVENFISSETIDEIVKSLINFGFKLAIAILVFIVGKFVIKSLHNWIRKLMTRRNTDASLASFVLSLIKITLYFILIITVIGIIGIETSSFLALFASAGVAVGLALSGTMQNFAGGVLILLLKPYKVGDFIEAQGFSGTVKEIQIFNTIINTPDNKAIIIPNGGLSTSSINNYSLENQRRIDWNIGIAYGTDIDHARKIILDILSKETALKSQPNPVVYVSELADSSVILSVRAWVPTAQYWEIFFKYNELFYKTLPKEGIEFPFPQVDVHIQNS